MKNRKRDIIQFLVCMRNGSAFCITWLLILLLIYSYIYNQQTISINILTKMLLLILGGVFIFSILFTQSFIKKWSFTKRLTAFMVSITVYECAGFYWIGIFTGKGTLIQWIIFIGIMCVLFFCCIAIYQRYSKKQGEFYTQALRKYQKKRNIENEK